jgi:hypothetical protein
VVVNRQVDAGKARLVHLAHSVHLLGADELNHLARECRSAQAAGAWSSALRHRHRRRSADPPRCLRPGRRRHDAEELTTEEGLARVSLEVELAIVVPQALAVASFYRLFRPINPVAAWQWACSGWSTP